MKVQWFIWWITRYIPPSVYVSKNWQRYIVVCKATSLDVIIPVFTCARYLLNATLKMLERCAVWLYIAHKDVWAVVFLKCLSNAKHCINSYSCSACLTCILVVDIKAALWTLLSDLVTWSHKENTSQVPWNVTKRSYLHSLITCTIQIIERIMVLNHCHMAALRCI